jgi:hypothetical protein
MITFRENELELTKELPINVRLNKAQQRLVSKVELLKKLGKINEYRIAPPEEDYEGIDLWVQFKPGDEFKSVQAKGRESGRDFIVERILIRKTFLGDTYDHDNCQLTYQIGRDYKSLLSGNYLGVFNFTADACFVMSAKKMLDFVQQKEKKLPIDYEKLQYFYPQQSGKPVFPTDDESGIVTKYVSNASESYAKVIIFIPNNLSQVTWNLT